MVSWTSEYSLTRNKKSASRHLSVGIDTQEDEQQEGEPPQRRTAIAEERQRNAYHRRQSKHHSHIDKQVEEEYRHHRIAIYAAKAHGLALGKMDETQDEGEDCLLYTSPSPRDS